MAQQDDSGHDEDSSSLVPLPLPSRPPAASGLVPLQNGSPTSSKPATSTPLVIATVGNGSPTTPASSSSFASASSSSALAAPASNSGSNSAQNGDGEAPEADGAMSGHHHYHDGSGGHQHGQPNPYATPPGPAYSASPAVSLSSNPYTSYSPTTVSTQPGDPYRPNAVIGSPISLPSMRTIDASSQQVATSHLSHQSMGLNLNVAPTPVPSSMPFYPHQPMPQAGPYYALPHDPRLLGSRGPKKEIKRRTKTGCLTCRKRRIKCDETHPTCNNCKKSKRECLGYDPIFRQAGGSQSLSTSPLATTHSLLGAGGPQSSPGSQPTTPSSASAPVSIPSSSTTGPRQTATYNPQQQQQQQQPPYYSNSSYPSNQSPTHTPIATPTSATSTTGLGYDPNYPTSASATPSIKNEPCYQLSPSGLDHTFRMLPSTALHHHDSARLLDSKLISDHNTHLRGGAPSA
jgi:hypothetical protein